MYGSVVYKKIQDDGGAKSCRQGFTALMLVVGFRVFTLHRVSLGFCLRLKRGPSILVRVGPGTLKTMNPSCLEIGTAYLSTMPPPLCPSRILGGDH